MRKESEADILMNQAGMDYEVDLRVYWYTIVRHMRLIIMFVVIATCLIVLKIQSEPDMYSAYTDFLIENKGYSIGTQTQYYRMPDTIDSNMIEQWLMSTPVMAKIQNFLGPETLVSSGNYSIYFPIRRQTSEPSTQLLVSVTATAHTPKDAHQMAESMVKAFRSQLLDNQLQQTRESLTWMAERLADQKKKVEEAESRFQDYKQKIMVVSFDEQQKAESVKILDATSDISALTSQRLQLEVQLGKLRSAMDKSESYSDLAFSSHDIQSVSALITEWNKLKAQFDDLTKVFKEKHPKIEEISSQMATLRSRIETEKSNTIKSFEIKVQTFKDQEEIIQKTVDDHKESATDISQKEWQYRALEREVQTNSELYNSLLGELESTDLKGKIESTSLSVIEPPIEPVAPDSKHILGNILLAIFIGLATGVILAFLIDYFESTFRTPDDIERRLGIPVVGMIPERE